MTIRRQWLFVLALTALIAVSVNSLILSSLINRYFLSYNTDTYNYHIGQLQQLAKNALIDQSLTGPQLSVQLESHLDDPIIAIRLYDAGGELAASAEAAGNRYGMMGAMIRKSSEEIDSFEVTDGGTVIGMLLITRYSALNNSLVSTMFKAALIRNSVVSFAIVMIVLLIFGLFTSRRLSRDLTNTAAQALSIDMGDTTDFKPSKIREIRVIQSSLETLHKRLKIKQMGRKRIVDELVHQTRTPLTILKTHLEGLEDGVINMSADEIKVCQSQVDGISAIISSMSMLIDADQPAEEVRTEEIDLHALLSQIVGGMRVQFEKKKILLQLTGNQKLTVTSDRYKLSQSVYNLLTNAYKFTGPGGTVELSCEKTGNGIEISVRDTGIGIAKEDLPHLFDAYFRGRNSSAGQGDGLGLFIAKENLAQIGASIRVESEPGSGSRFTITIPDGLSGQE